MKKKKKKLQCLFEESMAKNFPYLRKEVNIKFKKAQQNASKINLKRLTYQKCQKS